ASLPCNMGILPAKRWSVFLRHRRLQDKILSSTRFSCCSSRVLFGRSFISNFSFTTLYSPREYGPLVTHAKISAATPHQNNSLYYRRLPRRDDRHSHREPLARSPSSVGLYTSPRNTGCTGKIRPAQSESPQF